MSSTDSDGEVEDENGVSISFAGMLWICKRQ